MIIISRLEKTCLRNGKNPHQPMMPKYYRRLTTMSRDLYSYIYNLSFNIVYVRFSRLIKGT